jgi:hypothetical protein
MTSSKFQNQTPQQRTRQLTDQFESSVRVSDQKPILTMQQRLEQQKKQIEEKMGSQLF